MLPVPSKPVAASPNLFSSRHRNAIILSLVVAALAYLLFVISMGYESAIKAFQRFGVTGWLLILAISFSNYSLRFLRWQYYLKVAGQKLAPGLHFRYYLSAFALTTTPGKAGELIRSVLLRPHGVTYHTSLACFFTERFLDLVVVCMLALLALLHFPDYRHFVLVFMILLIILLPVMRSKRLLAQLHHWQTGRAELRPGKLLRHIHYLLKNAQLFLAIRPLYTGLLIGIVAWALQGIAFFYILYTLGNDTSFTLAMGIYAISLLAGAASFIPGGIGSTELVMGLLLLASGADKSTALTAPLISRLSTLWFAVFVGLLAAGSLGLHRGQQYEDIKEQE